MDLREEAKVKDAIIRYMLDNATYRDLPRMFVASDFNKPVFDRKLKSDYIDRLVKEIIDYPDKIITHVHNNHIECNSVTQRFMDSGGFERLYDDMVAGSIEARETREQEQLIKSLQITNLQLSNELSEQKIKTHRIPIGISIFGALIALTSLVWSILSTSHNVTVEQLNPKIKIIEERLEQLENGLKQKDKEVEQLRKELNKAEMMVRVLEDVKP